LSRQTIGPQIMKVLARCGPKLITPMPWQRDVADVVGEIDPATGKFWYRTYILILPRQGGKTTFVRGKLTHRALMAPGQELLYTAQDRNMARKRLQKTIYNPLNASPLAKYLGKPRWAAGSEAVRFKNNSEINIIALSLTAGHGDTLDEAAIDEAFAHTDNRIEQNVNPTMITVEGAQKGIMSAAGGLESSFLWNKVERGRAMVELGADSRTCYIEYAAAMNADPDDPATYLCHPAVGHTIKIEDILEERRSMEASEFERAYLGWWPRPESAETVFPRESWVENYVDPSFDTWMGVPMWCLDVSPNRQWAAIGLAAKSYDPAARCFVEVIDHDEGTAWTVGRLQNLRERFGGDRVAVDAAGAASALVRDLEAVGFEVIALTPHDRMDACGGMFDDVVQGKVKYLNDPVLNGAMQAAAKINAAGGEAFVFSRGKSMADITPLYAATLARYAYIKTAPDDYDIMDSVA
jgi:phage terminase large subunit-like protein